MPLTSAEDFDTKQNCTVSSAAVCLYSGALARNIIFPILDDRNGNLNTYLIRYFNHYGVIDGLTSLLVFIFASLYDALEDLQQLPKVSEIANLKMGDKENIDDGLLSVTGRCALNALPFLLPLLRKFVQVQSYIRSPITTLMVDDVSFMISSDELGAFQLHRLLHEIFITIGESLLPLFKKKLITSINFPGDIQDNWLALISDLTYSLSTSLPQPKHLSNTEGTSSSSKVPASFENSYSSSARNATFPFISRYRSLRDYGTPAINNDGNGTVALFPRLLVN
jgi:hypothetical protein